MVHYKKITLGLLFFTLTFTPFLASAQYTFYGHYRQQSADAQQKLSALGAVAETNISIPVLFGVPVSSISPNFGDPRSGGRSHEGEDIMAVKGTPIVSPTPAVVIRTGVGVTEGNYVYTANPGGETFVYMHLDTIGEGVNQGVVLPKGGLIGYVGNTGNASGGAAHLHFEIHDASDVPQNPFPRLTNEFTLQEKISYLTGILSQTSNKTGLASLLVTNFRSTFVSAQNAGITLPQEITTALSTTAPVTSNPGTLPAGDLDVGSSGSLVVALQQYLILAAKGPQALSLSKAGATGNFGPMTKAALAEFQTAAGITPANGYYGASTQTYIATHAIATVPVTSTPTPTTTVVALTRSLSLGMSGEDVRILQKLLNTKGFTIAISGAGSVGNESTYFGPATQKAVIAYQVAKNITPAAGYVGPVTRAALGSL